MLLRNKFKKLVRELNDVLAKDFKAVGQDVDQINGRIDSWGRQHADLKRRYDELENELATNGVIRDIRALQRELNALQEDYLNHRRELDTNGVATAINKLNAEVFKDRKTKKSGDFMSFLRVFSGEDVAPEEEATLAGKVDAIIEHLGLDLSVAPESVTEAKVVAKKAKTTKKKGRR